MSHENYPDHQLVDQNQQLSAEIKRRVSQLAAINTVAASVSQTLDMDRALQTALGAVLDVTSVEAAGISLVDEQAGMLVLRAQRGLTLDFVADPLQVPLGEGLSGVAVREDHVIVSGDLRNETRLAVPSFIKENIQAQALVPMHARGRVIGVLSVMSHAPVDFLPEELDMLRAIADQIGVALENARLYEKTHLQERRLDAVIQSAADPILATDEAGRISVVNEAARRFLERAATELLGKPLLEAPFKPQFRSALLAALETTVDYGRFDLVLDDDRAYTAVLSRLRSNSQGEPIAGQGWVIVLRDVSQARKAERTRLEFMQNLAHDLRNPLGVTLSSVTMLHDIIGVDDPDMEEIYGIALEAIDRMHNLIDNLLNLETIQNGGEFYTSDIDVGALLAAVLREMRPTLEENRQSHELVVDQAVPLLHGSYDWLYRAIQNYVSNAAKYTPEGGHITIRSYTTADEVMIEVEDNGPGIPVQAQAGLFQRFYRVPTIREVTRGSGLGLAIVRSVAEAHGGRVYVHSEPETGSRFGIALPLKNGRVTD